MMRMPDVLGSVRGRLLALLLAAIVLAALVQGGFAYRSALAQTDELFDAHLERTAVSLARGTPMFGDGLPGGEGAANDDLLIQVWSADGVRIYRSAPRIVLPEQIVLGFANVRTEVATYRMYSVRTPTRIIQVGQDIAVRRGVAGRLAWRTVLPVAAMAPLLMLLVWWAVGTSLKPVERVRRALAGRQPGDLSTIDERPVPEEIRPLIAEMNLLFARVDQAFGAQRQFVADAAHELRTPLTALRLQLDALARATDPAAVAQATARLRQGIERARRLVEQLLLLAREDMPAPAARSALPLVDAVREAIGEALPLAQARGIDLGMVRDDAAMVEIAPEAVRTLLGNLIDNAVKYTPAGGRVDVGVAEEGDVVRLWVDDSGPGIPPDERERVFDRFVRIAGTDGEGSGLGLAIVRTIAARESVEVRLDEAPELGGLRAELRFPRRAAGGGASSPARAQS